MRTLADEILGILSAKALPLSDISSRLGSDHQSVRRAAQALNDNGHALLVRRRRTLHLASTDYAGAVCKNCYGEFVRPIMSDGTPSKRLTCSRFCHAAWGWKSKPGARERKIAGIKKHRATPEAKARLAAHNERRWSNPEQHKKLSEQNRREWADPEKKAKRAASIRAVNGSVEFRKLCSDIRKAYWQEPELRDEHLAAIRAARRTPEARRATSAANKRRYEERASRQKYLAVSRENIAKATAKIKGKKQSPEHVRKRTVTMKKTKQAQRAARLASQGASA